MKIAPSILTANFAKLETEIKSIDAADLLHIDIMDGHFVPNISFGPHIIKCLADVTDKKLDVHLMTTNPLDWINKFAFKTTEYITIHVEANDFEVALDKIKQLGIKVGISLKPNTNLDLIVPYLSKVDLVLVMSVEPGFGGQGFMESSLDKISKLSQLKKKHNYQYEIEVDGGINNLTAALCANAGATILVAGSYVFNQSDRNVVIKELQSCG